MEPIILSPPAGLRQWVQLYCLYRRSFPRSERKPFRIILKKYRAGNTHIWCILQTGKFLGFAATMNSPDLVMLDYLAISRKHRGRGIGTAAMTQLLACYRDRGFLLEIESPYEPGPDQALRQRRKQFYVNCGLEPIPVRAEVFGVNMELLGVRCTMDYPAYQNFYRDNYSQWAADHIRPVKRDM